MPTGMGGEGGGAVTQQTAPWAAMAAGNIGFEAAKTASAQATAALKDAMTFMNDQYIAAVKGMQPYTKEGISALYKLNSYLQLPALNPGTKPVVAGQTPYTKGTPEELEHLINMTKYNENGNIVSGLKNLHNQPGSKNLLDYAIRSLGRSPGDYRDPDAAELRALQTNNPEAYDELNKILDDPKIQKNKRENDLNALLAPNQQLQLDNWNLADELYKQYTASGPATAEQIVNEITNQPGYQSQLTQGIDAVQKSASAKGYLGSGKILKELNQWGQNTLSTYYGNTLSRLGALVGAGQAAAGTTGSLTSNLGNNVANLYNSMGEAQANSTLTGANSIAQALIAANQQFDVVGGGGGGGLGGLGSLLGGAASLKTAFSSKALKDFVAPVSTQEILDKVAQLELNKWKYKNIDREHLGPYAEQFKELFGIGDGKTINLIDAVGILLASVQELNNKINIMTEERTKHGN